MNLTTSDLLNRWVREFDRLFELSAPCSNLSPILLSNHFPPCNYYAEDDGTLHFDFAVAGYAADEIDLKFEDDFLILTLEPKEEKEDEGFQWFQKAIRRSESVTKARVPFAKYDRTAVGAAIADGLLKVIVPVKEEAKPVSIYITKK